MAFKFNEITFDLKDLILIIGLVAGYFNFKSEQTEQFNELKTEIKQIVADNKLQEVKYNARFDMLNKPTSQKTDTNSIFNYVAVCQNNRIEIVKKRLFKFKLV